MTLRPFKGSTCRVPCYALGTALALAGVTGAAATGPRLLDLHGTGPHAAVVRHGDVRTYTIDDIVERNGQRVPPMAEAASRCA